MRALFALLVVLSTASAARADMQLIHGPDYVMAADESCRPEELSKTLTWLRCKVEGRRVTLLLIGGGGVPRDVARDALDDYLNADRQSIFARLVAGTAWERLAAGSHLAGGIADGSRLTAEGWIYAEGSTRISDIREMILFHVVRAQPDPVAIIAIGEIEMLEGAAAASEKALEVRRLPESVVAMVESFRGIH